MKEVFRTCHASGSAIKGVCVKRSNVIPSAGDDVCEVQMQVMSVGYDQRLVKWSLLPPASNQPAHGALKIVVYDRLIMEMLEVGTASTQPSTNSIVPLQLNQHTTTTGSKLQFFAGSMTVIGDVCELGIGSSNDGIASIVVVVGEGFQLFRI